MVSVIQILTSVALRREKSGYQLLWRGQEMLWLLDQCSWLNEYRGLLMGHHSIVIVDKELILDKAWLMLKILLTLEGVLVLFWKLLNWLSAWRPGMGGFRWKSSYWVGLWNILPLHEPWIWCEISATWCSHLPHYLKFTKMYSYRCLIDSHYSYWSYWNY